MSETDVINQKPFYEMIFCFGAALTGSSFITYYDPLRVLMCECKTLTLSTL